MHLDHFPFSSRSRRVSWMAAAMLASTMVAHAAPLPGGASSLVETYQDWVVACQAESNATTCVTRQVQTNTKTNQQVFAAEFRNGTGGKLEGVLLLPFGLALAQGVALKIDEAAGPALSFSTCLPQGCVAPVNFDAAMTAKLKAGTSLNATAMGLSPAQPASFKISLKGFAAALSRIADLTK